MKFKIGSIVEVFTKKKVDFGSWRCAEIVGYNGGSYTVKYHWCGGIPNERANEVKIEDVRPSAPSIDGCITYSVGDVVEVLHEGYWKVSLIEEVLGEDYYQIQVVGSIVELRVEKSSIRARQEWKENKWMLMEKVSRDCEDLVSRMRRRIHMQQQQQQCDYKWQLVPDSSYISKLLKRSSPDSPTHSEDYSDCTQKRRAVNKEFDLDVIIDDSYSFIGKDHFPLVTKKTSTCKAKLIARTTKPADSVSNISSVASCSITDAISDRGLSHSSAGCSDDNDHLSSDAESLKREDFERPHDLDLCGYRCILETLYASGPLTWDQELLLTNLRMKFCVSNDDHLAELRRLKCVGGVGLRCH